MSNDEQVRVLDELQGLLDRQVELARQGDSASGQIERLGVQADCLVQKISHGKVLERTEYESRRKELRKSYENLCLALTAQKADVAERLGQVRRGKRIVGTYRDHI